MADVSHCDACGAASSSSFTGHRVAIRAELSSDGQVVFVPGIGQIADSDAHGGWSKLLLLVMPMSPIGAVGSLRLVMCAPCTDRLLDAIAAVGGDSLTSRYDVLTAQRREKLRRGGE